MNKLKSKAVYEAPLTERFQVELEGVFCSSVDVSADNKTNGQIESHGVNDGFTATFGDSYGGSSNWE
jgi:hypothetical protein